MLSGIPSGWTGLGIALLAQVFQGGTEFVGG